MNLEVFPFGFFGELVLIFKCLVGFTDEAICPGVFFVGMCLISNSVSFVTDPISLSISSEFSLVRLYVPRNLSVFSKLSNLLVYSCS